MQQQTDTVVRQNPYFTQLNVPAQNEMKIEPGPCFSIRRQRRLDHL